MKTKIMIAVNLLGSAVWFFNYIMTGILLCAGVGVLQLFIAAFLLTTELKLGKIK